MRTLIPLLVAAACAADTAAWLGGSSQKGGKATYELKDGVLTGTAVAKTPNSFLCTDKNYGDFTLEYEFNVDSRLNSGVQIRSNAYDKETTFTDASGKVIKIAANRVHGYQVEIDTDPTNQGNRQWTGGVFDESRRGWLFPGALGGDKAAFSEQGRRLTKVGDWNHVRIEAVGPRIRTWLNGELRADVLDGATRSGFIGFQVHSIGKPELVGTQNRWRNVKLAEVAPNTLTKGEKDDGWTLLFNGTSTDAWKSARSDTFPAKGWQVSDGILSVLKSGGGESTNGGDIVTKRTYRAFEFMVDFRITEGANSGIKYFAQPLLNKGAGSAFGLEFQILDDARHPDAKEGREGNRTIGSLYDLMTASKAKQPAPIGEWNHAFVRTSADGLKVEHWLNGLLVISYDRSTEEFRALRAKSKYAAPQFGKDFGEWKEGTLLLQDHGDRVDFRNIKVRDLSGK
jgi:hypothetical protein